MDTDNLRESGDEQDEQDEQDDQDDQEDQEDEIENQEKTRNETEPIRSEARQESRTVANANRKPRKQSRKSRSKTPQKDSPTLNHQSKRCWKSANAFINFVQDFKKDYPDNVLGRNLFQMCGERWKTMTDDQKQPYISAANTVKRLKQRKIGEVEQQMKKSFTRVSKRKAETKRKESSKKRSKANIRDAMSNSDTDTATTTVHSSMSDADSF